MKRSAKLALILATVLTVVGLTVSFFATVAMGFDFRKLNTDEFSSKTHTVAEDFAQIKAELCVSDLRLAQSEDGTCRVECYERSNMPHTVTVENGTLLIREVDERKWYDHVGIRFGESTVTVYLPKAAFERLAVEGDTCDVTVPRELSFGEAAIDVHTGDVTFGAQVERMLSVETTTGDVTVADTAIGGNLNLKTDTGEITLRSVTAFAVYLETDTGEVELSDVSCSDLLGKSDTGEIILKNVTVAGHLQLESDTGDIELERCDAATLRITTNTGDVEGVLLSDKTFVTDTSTGDIDVPRYTAGGSCEITTDTGDIEIRIAK